MNCPKCNAPIQDGVQFCPNCGNNLVDNNQTNPVNEVNENVNQNASFQDNAMNQVNNVPIQDKVNIWLVILSWFIPLAGLIIFFVKKKTSPKTAKVSGICALISAILSIIVVILSVVFVVGSLNFAIDKTNDMAEQIIEDAYEQIEDVEDLIEDDIESNSNSDSTVEDSNDTTVDSSSTTTPSVEVSNDWKLYQVGINGAVYTIPMAYNDFKTATGFALKDTQLNLTIQNNYYALASLYKNDKLALHVELFNNTGAEIKYPDAKVSRISQTKYQVSQGADKIVFPGGIKVGDAITDAQMVTLFGTPSDLKDYGTSKQYTYVSDTTWTTTNNFKITIVNGVIDEIQLDHRN